MVGWGILVHIFMFYVSGHSQNSSMYYLEVPRKPRRNLITADRDASSIIHGSKDKERCLDSLLMLRTRLLWKHNMFVNREWNVQE